MQDVFKIWGSKSKFTHLIRSKTVMRLPTGDNRQVPSGVKRRFPLQYTVPSRLENYSGCLVVVRLL